MYSLRTVYEHRSGIAYIWALMYRPMHRRFDVASMPLWFWCRHNIRANIEMVLAG